MKIADTYLKKVLFLTNANKKLGSGHLTRCLRIASYLKHHDISSYFLINKNTTAIELIQESGFQSISLSRINNARRELSVILELHKKLKFSCLIIDLMKEKNKFFFEKTRNLFKTLVIDSNPHTNNLYADAIIWPDIKEFYPKKTNLKHNKIFVGPEYMPINNIKSSTHKRSNSILISMGGSDKMHFTKRIIESFKSTNYKFNAIVVLGKFFTDTEEILSSIKNDKRFTIIQNNNNLIPLMQNSKIGIFTYGVTTYEALFVGLPSLVISHSKENDIASKKLNAYDCIQYLGYHKYLNFKKIPSIAILLMNNPRRIKRFSKNAQELVDGRGVERISRLIIKLMRY